jgi:hypothetical protein
MNIFTMTINKELLRILSEISFYYNKVVIEYIKTND